MTSQLTLEQRQVVDLALTGLNVICVAGAGTGKTTTLKAIAQEHRGRGLYMAFNAAVRDEARKKFAGTGVRVMTTHGLAFKDFGAPLQDRMETGLRNWNHVAPHLNVRNAISLSSSDYVEGAFPLKKIPVRSLIGMAKETLKAFTRSADFEMTLQHVQLNSRLVGVKPEVENTISDTILGIARSWWNDLVHDPHGRIRVEHEHYLKLFQMSKPRLPFDFIEYDESQDADPVIVDVLQRQDTQIISVGDKNQAIYEFRGAVDLMETFGGAKSYLTQSFRFGPNIAAFANDILTVLNSELKLVGNPAITDSVGPLPGMPDATLCRSNMSAISYVVGHQARGARVGIAGKRASTQIAALATAAVSLTENGETSHSDLSMFSSWDEVVDYSKSPDGLELMPLVNVINKFGAKRVQQAVKDAVPVDEADTVVSTVHVAKGLEWGSVQISEEGDFDEPGISSDTDEQKPLDASDARLMYVAATRAMYSLDAAPMSWISNFSGDVV